MKSLKSLVLHTFRATALAIFLLSPSRTVAIELRPLTLISHPTEQRVVESSIHKQNRSRPAVGKSELQESLIDAKINSTRLLVHAPAKRNNSWFASPETLDWMQSIAEQLSGATAPRQKQNIVGQGKPVLFKPTARAAVGSASNSSSWNWGAADSTKFLETRAPPRKGAGAPVGRASFLQRRPIIAEDEEDLHMEQESFLQVTSSRESSSLPPASTGQVWVIRQSSNLQTAPLLSEYVPDPRDTYAQQESSPWKIVTSVSRSASLVVESITAEQWTNELSRLTPEERIASTRRTHSPLPLLAPRMHSASVVEKTVNGAYAVEVAEEATEGSPFLLQHLMPLAICRALGHRLSKVAASVSSMGLVQSQMLASAFMVGLIVLFFLLDRGYQKLEEQQENKNQRSREDIWWRQLTSWETGEPAIEYMEADSHLG